MEVCTGLPYIPIREKIRKYGRHHCIASGFKMDDTPQNILCAVSHTPARRCPICVTAAEVTIKMNDILLLNILRFVFVCVPYCAAAALLYFPERSFLKTASTKLNEDLIQHVGVSQRKLTHGFMVCSLCFFCFSRSKIPLLLLDGSNRSVMLCAERSTLYVRAKYDVNLLMKCSCKRSSSSRKQAVFRLRSFPR